MPGVLAVLTGADYVAEGLGHIPRIGPPVKRRDGSTAYIPPFLPVTPANARELGGCIGHYDGNAGRYTLFAPIQHPLVARKVLALTIFSCDEINVRVVTGDIGGSFGIKANIYPEYVLAL